MPNTKFLPGVLIRGLKETTTLDVGMYKRISNVGCVLCETFHIRYSCSTVNNQLQNNAQNALKKEQNVKLIKRYNKENKILFGDLVETPRQKRKRDKNKPISKEPIDSIKYDKSSEAWWWRNHSVMQTRRPEVQHEASHSSSSRLEQRDNTSYVHDIVSESTCVSINDGHLHNETSNRSVNADKDKVSSIFHKSNLRLPQIMVKNITTFPLTNERKCSFNNNADSSSILIIPMNEPNDSARNRYFQYPSVSKILNATLSDSSRAALQKWKENMILELGEEGFQKYQEALLHHGSMFHSTVQRYLSGTSEEEIPVDPAVEGCWQSLSTTLKDVTDVKVLESHVVHKQLFYHGIIDCVAVYKGKQLLIEWKKSNKQKSAIWNTYDAPLQLAAYMGAMNFDSNYNMKVQGGLVAVAYTDGSPAHVHHMNLTDCQKYWHLWLKRLQLYWELFNKQEAMKNISKSL